jgi:hypothetical protein
MRIHPALLLAPAIAALSGPARAADAAAGERLHQQHCVSCHASLTGGNPDALYTRADRRVKSLDGLRKQVQRCELSLGLKWFEDDVASVVAYLNQAFYQFKP